MNFELSWNWADELSRLYLEDLHPDLKEMVDEILPFSTEFAYNLIAVMSDDEALLSGIWSEESLIETYLERKGQLTQEKKDYFNQVKQAWDSF